MLCCPAKSVQLLPPDHFHPLLIGAFIRGTDSPYQNGVNASQTSLFSCRLPPWWVHWRSWRCTCFLAGKSSPGKEVLCVCILHLTKEIGQVHVAPGGHWRSISQGRIWFSTGTTIPGWTGEDTWWRQGYPEDQKGLDPALSSAHPVLRNIHTSTLEAGRGFSVMMATSQLPVSAVQ